MNPILCAVGSVYFLTSALAGAPADETLRLQESFAAGYCYHVSTRTELSGSLTTASGTSSGTPALLPITGTSAIEYDERVLETRPDGQVQKTARIYRRVDFRRKVGERDQANGIRPAVRRLVVLRHQQMEVPFSPDGALTWDEIDVVRTDVFTPALSGLFPARPVRPGDTWTAITLAVQELTDMERIEEGQIECRLEEVLTLEKRRHARVAMSGIVRGVNEDGPNRQQIEGYYFFDLESNHLSYLTLHGVSSLLDKQGKVVGRLEGRFVLTRQAPQACGELSDAGLRGVALEPTAENTLLLYDNADLGLRFLYPRRWRVAATVGSQVTLESAGGNGLLMTVESADRATTGAQFHAEVNQWLSRQKAKVLRSEGPRRVAGAAELEHFTAGVELADKPLVLDYYVLRQPNGGATLAARLSPSEAADLQGEIERVARSLTITRPVVGRPATPK
jgi:hypothetical protein